MADLELTPAETFFVWRRRNNMTMEQAAVEFMTSLYHIQQIESGIKDPPSGVTLNGPLSKGERCTLMRKRARRSVEWTARATGTSRMTVIKREANNGNVDDLLSFWEHYYKLRAS